MHLPETRASLILRLSDAQDVDAWDEFVAIYQPLVFRLARRKGMQDADAQELTQEVLLAVSRSVDRWVPDPQRGRFRDWLFRIARNMAINLLTRPKYRGIGSGDSAIARLLDNQFDRSCEESQWFDLEYGREVFRWAGKKVREEVKPHNWQAFWRTSVEGRPAAEVAEALGIDVGHVYIARSRVMARLQRHAKKFREESDDNTSLI